MIWGPGWADWGGFFDVENRQIKINEERQLTGSSGFWEDNERATAILKNIKVNEYWLKLYQAVETAVEDFAVLLEFWKAGEATEEETRIAYDKSLELIDEAEFKSTLNEPEDELLGRLQKKTGRTKDELKKWFNSAKQSNTEKSSYWSCFSLGPFR